ncbi:helix-turn-helix transcriptional regulator [Danxiaibacter flavus]|uniref:Helix-turn-helix transcriptional regulator n=1 Tax=Danxiaibacter flavus TaxID=3049108 RepID=A0ABV3ZH34_9BACT|nr:helix-turn-helix transcriptional regulator [Chitinophagaceae bacterium DXS]
MEKTIHQGRNIRHFREMLGLKQEGLAMELGDDWNQRKISLLEQKEVIEEDILAEVAKALKVPVDAIKNFDVQDTIFNIQNNYEGSNTRDTQINTTNNDCTINYADRWLEAVDEIKKLYERLLQAEKEKVELMERMLGKGK